MPSLQPGYYEDVARLGLDEEGAHLLQEPVVRAQPDGSRVDELARARRGPGAVAPARGPAVDVEGPLVGGDNLRSGGRQRSDGVYAERRGSASTRGDENRARAASGC